MLDIADRQLGEDVIGIVDPGVDQLANLIVVEVSLGDRLLEDRGIARQSGDVFIGDAMLELTRGDELATDEVEPDRLAVFAELLQRGCHIPTSAGATTRW